MNLRSPVPVAGQTITDRLTGSENGILHFTFKVIVSPATGPGDLKFLILKVLNCVPSVRMSHRLTHRSLCETG